MYTNSFSLFYKRMVQITSLYLKVKTHQCYCRKCLKVLCYQLHLETSHIGSIISSMHLLLHVFFCVLPSTSQSFLQPLVILSFSCSFFSDGPVSSDCHIYHSCPPLLLVSHHCVWLFSQQLLVSLELEVL